MWRFFLYLLYLQFLESVYMLFDTDSGFLLFSEDAKEIYDNILLKNKVTTEIMHQYAILSSSLCDSDTAEKMLKKIIRINPDLAKAHKDLGIIYLNKRLFDYADEEFKEAMKGIYSTSVQEGTLDESPFAYKSIKDIIPNILPTVDIIKILKPIYNFKACKNRSR